MTIFYYINLFEFSLSYDDYLLMMMMYVLYEYSFKIQVKSDDYCTRISVTNLLSLLVVPVENMILNKLISKLGTIL